MLHRLLVSIVILTLSNGDYLDNKARLIKLDESHMLGSSIELSELEIKANKILMKLKTEEYDEGFANPRIFIPSRHFFEVRNKIEDSKVFQVLQNMPKGAALHGHDTALVSQEYLYNLTFKDDLYGCSQNNRLNLKFLESPQQDTSCNWILLSTLRKRNPNFDGWLKSQLTLNVTNPREKYPDINVVWKELSAIFKTATPLITYRPVFEEYFYQALKELYEDSVSYLEFRGTLPGVYELDGTVHGPTQVLKLYNDVIKKFKSDHPDFIGSKFIYGPRRSVKNETISEYIKIIGQLKNTYPNLLAGFDLVGQEDLGRPLNDFIDHLHEIPKGVNFYFHAAETNWYGTTTDENLIDAILMGTKRIGHGFGLIKHPILLDIVKEKNIAIEICPISNQVLMLVADLRNHPGAFLMAGGYPVVISNDDPSYWTTKGLSYDFYMAFMGMASRNADLKLLKQLAINSIQYSSLSETEKTEGLKLWENKWNKFIGTLVHGPDTSSCRNNKRFSYILFLTILILHIFK